MEETNEIKLTIKLDPYNGTMTINLLDIIHELTDEQKKLLVYDGGWWSLISKEMFKDIVQSFSTECYSPIIYQFRKSLLTSAAIPNILCNFVEGIVNQTISRIRYLKQYELAYWKIFHDPAISEDDVLRAKVYKAYERNETAGLPKTGWVAKFVKCFLEENDITFPTAIEEETA
jgi:hypothetical protein